MATALKISERRIGTCCILRMSGRLVAEDGSTCFRRTMDGLIERGFLQFALNLRDVITLDSGGVGSIVAKYLSVRRVGGDLKLVSPSGRARHVLDIAGLLRIFEVFDDEAAAAASFHGSVTQS